MKLTDEQIFDMLEELYDKAPELNPSRLEDYFLTDNDVADQYDLTDEQLEMRADEVARYVDMAKNDWAEKFGEAIDKDERFPDGDTFLVVDAESPEPWSCPWMYMTEYPATAQAWLEDIAEELLEAMNGRCGDLKYCENCKLWSEHEGVKVQEQTRWEPAEYITCCENCGVEL